MAYSFQDYLKGRVSKQDLLDYSEIFDDDQAREALREFFAADAARNESIKNVFKAARRQRDAITQTMDSLKTSDSSGAASSQAGDYSHDPAEEQRSRKRAAMASPSAASPSLPEHGTERSVSHAKS
jgi:hypothetical protein